MRADGAIADVFDNLVFRCICAFDELENRARIGRADKGDVLFQSQAHGEVIFGIEVFHLSDLVGCRVSMLNPAWTALIDESRGGAKRDAARRSPFYGGTHDAEQLAAKKIGMIEESAVVPESGELAMTSSRRSGKMCPFKLGGTDACHPHHADPS